MVNHSIKVFARLKRQGNNENTVIYQIVKEQKFDDVIIYNNFLQQESASSFRFHKVFDQKSNQEDVFDNVAKPVVNSVLQGFNGTIFAYGQTGSGKTYTITGSPKNYNDRGIIPRSIQYVFAQNEKITVKPTIYISYMEIYNEVGYDLLCSRQGNTARSLEDLPRIVLLEDSNGEVHMRNLSVLPVTTEQEAMRLLFLGDTNRTIAETPMNEYSSRSHCIFTIYITFRDEPSNILRYSKLHLVDLAGSERVYKSLTTGTALREAKHINLSLHYLQQVILALSESNRLHVPYRNSMMTYILKDSLSGNCLTAMLATLTLNKDNIQETISTCRFAQRVSLISTAPVINEMLDPQKEIIFLRNKVDELRHQISQLSGLSTNTILDKNQEDQCQKEIENYLASPFDELKVEPSMSHIRFCFKLLKNKINSQNIENEKTQLECTQSIKEITTLRDTVDKQDQEINNLKKIIDDIPEKPINPKKSVSKNNLTAPMIETNKDIFVNYLPNEKDQRFKDIDQYAKKISFTSEAENNTEKQLFEMFLNNPENAKDLEYYTANLQKKLEMAKIYAEAIEQCQKNITYIREKLQTRSSYSVRNKLLLELGEQQKVYSKSLDDLKTVKNETYHLQSGLKMAEVKTMRTFKSWLDSQQCLKNLSKTNSRDSAYYKQNLSSSPALVEEENCYMCNSKQNMVGRPSTKDCSCEVDESQIPFGCCPWLQYPPSCWTNCWNANLRIGPVFQPFVVDQGQCRNHSTNDYKKSHSYKNDSIIFNRGINCLAPYQSNLLYEERELEPFRNATSKSKTCHSCSFISRKEDSNDKEEKNTNENNRRINCDYKEENRHFSEIIIDNNSKEHFSELRMYKNTEISPKEACLECSKDAFIASNSKTKECYRRDPCSMAGQQKYVTEPLYFEDQPETEVKSVKPSHQEDKEPNSYLLRDTDSPEFIEFMKTVTLTGDTEIDQEIFNFYRNKFC